MKFDDLREIIDFAIEKEQEAIDLYNDLAGKIKNKSIAKELRELALMEEGHRDRLKNLNLTAAATKVSKPAHDLKIADYLVEVKPGPEMTWKDVIQIAMKRELASMNLYTDLAKLVTDRMARRLFKNLAAEESSHKLYFEKIWDGEVLKDNK
ncbi:MAG: ferritin family protein [Deltaproteobacteria bacterium]|nr:ferritin family protein [Deltaproteobacteria bacterium]